MVLEREWYVDKKSFSGSHSQGFESLCGYVMDWVGNVPDIS